MSTQSLPKKGLSISKKIIGLSALLSSIFLSVTLFVTVRVMVNTVEQEIFRSSQIEANANGSQVEVQMFDIRRTLFAISHTPPIQGMFRALENEGYDELESSSYQQWKDRLAVIFTSEMNAKGVFDQIRYIDENGSEIVRVNNIFGGAETVAETDLQDKSDRGYFIEAMQLSGNELYISDIDLNREGENAEIEVPYKPVVRLAQSVVDSDGEKRGILIVNVLFDRILEQAKFTQQPNANAYVIDPVGYYLYHANAEKEWGGPHDLDTGESFEKDFPEVYQWILTNREGIYQTPEYVFSVDRILLSETNPDDVLYYIQQRNRDDVFAPLQSIIFTAIGAGVAAFVILFFVYWSIVHRTLAPLSGITKAAARIGQGNLKERIAVHTTDETGVLASAINHMAEELEDTYSDLEDRVSEKTHDLASKVDQLERTKSGMFNIIDDLDHEKALVQIERDKNEVIMESIGDGLAVTDQGGVIVLVNSVFSRLLGWTEEEVIGKKYIDIIHMLDENMEPVKGNDRLMTRALQEGVETKTTTGMTRYYKRKDGSTFPVYIIVSPLIVDGEVTGAVESFRDISDEKRIDKAKTEFVSLASHQLRTPLTSILWYVEMLINGDVGEMTEMQKQYLDEIQNGGTRMNELVNSLLNVSRLELGTFVIEPEQVHIGDVMKAMIKEQQPMIKEKKHDVSVEIDAAIQKVPMDLGLVEHVFQNVLSNALKYTPEEGHVHVNIVPVNAGQQFGTLSFEEDMYGVSISDNGMGIPTDQQQHIFEKLYRAENAKDSVIEGNGLGLYIVKSIVESVNGRIWFDSVEGKGTTFYIVFPAKGMESREGTRKISSTEKK